MNSVEGLVTQIQGLSSSASDVLSLHNVLKQADDSLHAESTRLLPFLDQLDPSKHSLGYLYFLEACTAGPVTTESASSFVLIIARFISSCAAEQIRLAPDKFISVCKRLKDQVLFLEEPLRAVAPMLAAIRKLQSSTENLTTLHPEFLLLCLLAKCYKTGLSILEEDIFEVDQPRDLYLYCYYGGMICIGKKCFRKALELLHNVVTAPMSTINAIAVEAYKKYILVSLIHHGQLSTSLPKYASTVAQRNLKSFCQPYVELANSYTNGKIADLEAYVQANMEKFGSDNNLGLVKQVVSSIYKRNIQRLTQTYLTLSLQDIANTVQLNSPKEAEMHVLQMIQDGEIYATINQKDGMVRFLEDPEQYKTCEMIERVDSSIQRLMTLSKKLTVLDELMSSDPMYLGKVGRERQRFDFDDFDSVPQRKEVSSKKEDEFGDLKSWMHKNGLPPCKVVLKERPSHDEKHRPIHYVAASEDLRAGDVAFSVPNSLVVTLERVLGNETVAELLTTNKLSELACLALYLMYEKKQGKKSFWYPYIKELDRQRGRGQLAVESPLLWSEDELAYLTGSPTKAEVLERAEGIKREYNELDTVWFMAGSLFQQYPYDIPTEAFPFEIFKQAFVAVQSCVVHLQKVPLARRFALVPLGPPLLAYRSNCKAMLSAVSGAIELVVDRPYKAGEPIGVWCGPQPNSKLLINYGFVDDDNSYDRLVVEAALNTEDPQYQDKRLVVQRNGKLSIQAFHVYAGKEKEAVSDMLPYLRLGYVSDPSEMQSVLSSQGPVCPVSPCMEQAVLEQLADYFNRRLAGYPTALNEDESLLLDPNLNAKKRVATQLVRLEKKILHACLQATIDLIDQLPDHTVSPCPAPYAPLLK
ncbi:hypothetical protein V6N13_110847 [Hibiscus sabdariffa]